jgi:hypothetical protein
LGCDELDVRLGRGLLRPVVLVPSALRALADDSTACWLSVVVVVSSFDLGPSAVRHPAPLVTGAEKASKPEQLHLEPHLCA